MASTDVNSLFQTHTIEAIKGVETQIRNDIEKKKQELRVLVGERYRDLINAADTIQEMKTASNEVLSGITDVSHLCSKICSSLDEKVESLKQNKEELNEHAFYSLATQMNLLVDTPEKIWSALDKHQYLLASQLYLLSQHIVDSTLHINTGQSRSGTNRDVYASFPIVHHQWAAISHFKPSILKGARSSLKDSTLPDKALSESLCCISLLDDFSPRQVFTEYLTARKAAIQDVFQPSFYSSSVKKQVCDITHLIKLTVHQIITLFYTDESSEVAGEENPLYYHVLHNLTNEKASVFQSLFKEDVDVITLSRYLPPLVSGFVPKLGSVPVSISASFIQKHFVEWLNGSIKDVHSGVRSLLSYVDNIKGLASIRDAVYDLLNEHPVLAKADEESIEPMKWSKYCEICANRSFSIWDEFFRPLFLERTKVILEKEFRNCFKTLSDTLSEVLKNVCDLNNKMDDSCWEHDITSFIWHEFSHDISSLVDNMSDGDDILSLKVNGFTPAVKRLCMMLNDDLHNILNDVKYFIHESEADIGDEKERKFKAVRKDVQKFLSDPDDKFEDNSEPFNKCVDASVIKEALYNIFSSNVASLCSEINNSLSKISERLNDGSFVDPGLVTTELDKATFLARFCLSVPEMCLNIHKIVDYDTELNLSLRKRTLSHQVTRRHAPKIPRNFELLEKQFTEQSDGAFSIWQKWLCRICSESVSKTLMSDDDFILFSTTNWEEVHIEEESESGEKMKSTIRVPSQISFYLSSLLYRMAEEFHRVGANLMEKSSINNLGRDIGRSILQSHETFLCECGKGLYQNRAFQMMFDLKFITKLFGGSTDLKDKDGQKLHGVGNRLISQLENYIDPFDLDVVVPHINAFAQKQIQSTSLLFGSISNIDKHAIQSGKPITSLSENHSIVELVSHPPRFMLLPLPGRSQRNQDNSQDAGEYVDYESSPLFLHQAQSTILVLV